MAESKKSQAHAEDTSLDAIESIENIDLKAMSYIQLRRLYATVMQAVDNVSKELTIRADEDNGGATVRVPVPSETN